MKIEELDNIDSGGLVSAEEDLLSLHTADRSGVEIRSSQDSTRITVRGEDTEVTITLEEDHIQSVEREQTDL